MITIQHKHIIVGKVFKNSLNNIFHLRFISLKIN